MALVKIQGPNPMLHAYKQQQHKQMDKQTREQKDKIDISQAAKSLQESHQYEVERERYVQEIKEQVQDGEYKVNHEKLASKMIDFWKRA